MDSNGKRAQGPRWRLRHGLVAVGMLLAATALSAADAASTPHARPAANSPKSQPLDLNTASKAQLKRLPWIGNAEADRIIAARPYLSKADIVTRAEIPLGVYQAIRRQIAVDPETSPEP